LTLIDSLEIFQAYGNTTDLHVDCETLFKTYAWSCGFGGKS